MVAHMLSKSKALRSKIKENLKRKKNGQYFCNKIAGARFFFFFFFDPNPNPRTKFKGMYSGNKVVAQALLG
jgi:hypothetical protein